MQIQIHRGDLLPLLHKALAVASKNQDLAITSHVLLDATTPTPRLAATDYDAALEADLPGTIARPGSTALPVAHLHAIVAAMPDALITIVGKPETHRAISTCGTARFDLGGLDPESFPDIAPTDDVSWYDVPKASLLALIDRTLFSASRDETRPQLCGVSFSLIPLVDEVVLSMVSTDGHRLSRAEDRFPSGCTGARKRLDAILPTKSINAIKRTLAGDGDTTQLGAAGGTIFFRNNGTTLHARKLDETFPDYTKVVPTKSPGTAVADKATLAATIRRVATFSPKQSDSIRFDFNDGSSQIRLSAQDAGKGEGTDDVPVEYTGPTIALGFAAKYILEVLAVIDGATVTLEVGDAYSPLLIRSQDDPGSLFVIMPQRL
jgi:DNA polymerase-3 subunit beta